MTKTIIGIILFLLQISLAVFFNQTVDLIVIIGIAMVFFVVILVKNAQKKYDVS